MTRGANAMRSDAISEPPVDRPGQTRWRVVIHLNRAGLSGALRAGEPARWEYRVYPRSKGKIGDIVFCFDEGNPHSRTRDARRPDSLVLCLCDPDLELQAEWFEKQCRTALKPHRWPEGRGMAKSAGPTLLEATNALLQHLVEQTGRIVEGLLGPAAQRRFEIQSDGAVSYGFPLGEAGALKSDRGTLLLHRWWLFLDHVCNALRKALPAGSVPVPGESPEARTQLATLLKLRAHLAANLLESESPIAVSEARDHVARYHSSLIEWARYNLESRSHDEDKHLKPRYRELGDSLFAPKPPTRWIRAVRWVGTRLLGFTPEDFGNWSTTRYFALREAFGKAQDTARPPGADDRDEDDLRGRILDEQWRVLHAAEAFFGERYELREVMVLSKETADVWKQARREAGRSERRLALVKDLLRSIPWPVMAFLLLVASSWSAFFASRWFATGAPEASAGLPRPVWVLFGLQYFILYACAVLMVLFSLVPMQRIQSLFQQAMPRIFGGMIFGYSLFSFTEEIWWVPLKMGWIQIIGVTFVLVSVSSLYFVFEVAGKVRLKEQILRKAAALLLVAFAQAYGIGLIVTDALGPHLIMPSIYKEVAANPESLQQRLGVDEAAGTAHGAALMADSIDIGGLQDLLEANGELYVLEVPVLCFWHPEIWFFPKLLTLWVGLALFFGIFVQILWQKEGLLQRMTHGSV